MMRQISITMTVAGAVGFVASGFVLPKIGPLLRHIELPIVAETLTIGLPDGGALTATIPLSRLQRYDRDGKFKHGWFVDAAGGTFAVRATAAGHIAVCSVRRHSVTVFDTSGTIVEPSSPCDWGGGIRPSFINQNFVGPFSSSGIEPSAPRIALSALALVPFWNPFAAWLLMLLGGIAWQSTRSKSGR